MAIAAYFFGLLLVGWQIPYFITWLRNPGVQMKLRLQLLKDSKSKLLDGTLIATVIFLSLVLVRLKGINNEFNMERNKHLKKVQRKL